MPNSGKSDERFRLAFESAPNPMVMVDESGKIVSVNAQAELLFGYSAGELLDQPIEILVPERFRPGHPGHRSSFFGDARVRPMGTGRDLFGLRKDGTEVPVEIGLNPIRTEEGAFTLASIVDISERKRSQQEMRKVNEEVRASEIRYRRLFEAAKDGILLLDAETGQITDANSFLVELLGISREELIGKSLWEIGPLKDIIASLAAFQELKVKKYIRYEHLPLAAKDGKEVHVEFISNVYFANGDTVIQCNIRDITERHRTEQTLRKTEVQLRQSQKMEAFGQLAAGVAHDFNNMLTVINGYSELVMGKLDKDSPLQADLDEIAKAGHRAASLTRQLLAFSRKQVLDPKVINLNQVAADLDKMLKRVIGEDIELVNVLAPDLWPIKVDPGQMEQVILNLAVNARDAMPHGGKLTIETANVELDEKFAGLYASVQSGPHALLSVTDTGCGMDKETRSRLFEPFFTTKGLGKGTGLGLATIYGIVKQSGGSIWVYSEPGQGTIFKIYLPRVKEPLDVHLPKKPRFTPPRGRETILLVEDEAPVRKLARSILEMHGYTVLEAKSGPDGVEISAKHSGHIQLLVSDVVMPGMSGTELSVHLSRLRPCMRTLFLSGYSSEAIAGHGHLTPDTAFLQKPYTPNELALKVRAVIDGE